MKWPLLFMTNCLFLIAPSAQAGGGCPATNCVPMTGTWSARHPQERVADTDNNRIAETIGFTVAYKQSGKSWKSRYGNVVVKPYLFLDYACPYVPNSGLPVGIGSKFSFKKDVRIGSKGTGLLTQVGDAGQEVTLTGNFQSSTHTISYRFTPTRFKARIKGSQVKLAPDGSVFTCRVDVSFQGKRIR